MAFVISSILTDNDALLNAAWDNPGIRDKDNVPYETFEKALVSEVEYQLMSSVEFILTEKFQVVREEFIALNSADLESSDAQAGLDDQVEATLQDFEQGLSADWLGKNTVDTRLHEEDADTKLAKSAAREIWKQATYKRKPIEILQSAGLLSGQILRFLEKKEQGMGTETLETTLQALKNTLGDDFDVMAAYEDLGVLFAMEDEVAMGASAQRLGLNEGQIAIVQMQGMTADDPADHLIQSLKDYKVKKAKRTGRKKKADEPSAAPTPFNMVAETLRERTTISDTNLAEGLGVSRPTFLKYAKGSTAFEPDDEQIAYMRGLIVENTNALLAAFSTVDSSDPMAIE